MNTTSASLLDRLRQPAGCLDQVAWARFAQLYTPLLFYWTQRLGLRPQDAADLVPEVVVTLVEKLPEFVYDRDGRFRAWLRTVRFNQCRTTLRRSLPAASDSLGDVPDQDLLDEFEEKEYRALLATRALRLMQTD